MPCDVIYLGKPGHTVIVCSRGGRRKKEPCFVRDCRRQGEVLCDWPRKAGDKVLTCDRLCCRTHARHVGTDKDYCLEHALQARRNLTD